MTDPTNTENVALDPRWEWIEVVRFDEPGPTYVRGRCRHLEVVPVESIEGETVAQLCMTCDTQLPGALSP